MAVSDYDLREEVLRRFSTQRLVDELARRGYVHTDQQDVLDRLQAELQAIQALLQSAREQRGTLEHKLTHAEHQLRDIRATWQVFSPLFKAGVLTEQQHRALTEVILGPN